MPKKSKKKQFRDNERMQLPNGCECTKPYIFPHNWNTAHANANEPWYLRFKFYDPIRCPAGKQINREGMNTKTVLVEKQGAALEILENAIAMLKDGYNPVAGAMIAPAPETPTEGLSAAEQAKVITDNTPLISALEWAAQRATWGRDTRQDMSTYLRRLLPAIRILRYDTLPVKAITIQHIENILAQACKTVTKVGPDGKDETPLSWSNYQKNRAKDYLSMHFTVMVAKRVLKENPCKGIKDLPHKTKKEDAYTPEQLRAMGNLLLAEDPDYAIFMMLFYDSGAREVEFMKLRKEDINLDRQTFTRQVLKGEHIRRADSEILEGVISDAALPYWTKIIGQAKDGDYIFSRGFRPGPKRMGTQTINKRWQRIVKPHFPNSRPYLMKHTNLTIVSGDYGQDLAAALAAHTTTDMVKKVYDKGAKQRNHDALRKKTNLQYMAPKVEVVSANCVPVACFLSPVSMKSIGA